MDNKESLTELTKLLGTLTKNEQLKTVIENISYSINRLNEANTEDVCCDSSNNDTISTESDEDYTQPTPHIYAVQSLLDRYMISKEGKNICDCLEDLNNNLKHQVNH